MLQFLFDTDHLTLYQHDAFDNRTMMSFREGNFSLPCEADYRS